MNKYVRMLSALALAGVMAACGSSSGTDSGTGGGTGGGSTGGGTGGGSTGGGTGGGSMGGGTGGGGSGFTQPAGTVAVNFTLDDTANMVYAAGNLEWKGSMVYDSTTRKITKDSTWGGPWAPLFDDGPWSAGGHEPAGETAGDHKWGVTVFVEPPATGSDQYEYGLNDTTYANGWIWRGANGTFTVMAGATAEITAQGQTMPPFGDKDIKLTLDTNNLLPLTLSDGGMGSWVTDKVQIKGSGWAWSETVAMDDGQNGDDTAGDGVYSFVLSNVIGAGKPFPHTGLVNSGEKIEFIWVLGPADGGSGVEYKDPDGYAADAGIDGFSRTGSTGAFTPATIDYASNKNTQINVP